MAIKITSINFIKESDVPQRVVNTEFSAVVSQVSDHLKKSRIPQGQAILLKIAGAKKYTRYQLQSRLQKNGHKVRVRSGREEGTFFIQSAE